MKPIRDLLVLGVVLLAMGCSARETRLRSLVLWRGAADCDSCRANSVDLMTQIGTLRLARQATYTVQAQLAPGEQENRCIYYMVYGASWQVLDRALSHEFLCSELQPTVSSAFSTNNADGGVGNSMTISVQEFDSALRQSMLQLYRREFEVGWEE